MACLLLLRRPSPPLLPFTPLLLPLLALARALGLRLLLLLLLQILLRVLQVHELALVLAWVPVVVPARCLPTCALLPCSQQRLQRREGRGSMGCHDHRPLLPRKPQTRAREGVRGREKGRRRVNRTEGEREGRVEGMAMTTC